MTDSNILNPTIRNLQHKNFELRTQIEAFQLALNPNIKINELSTEKKKLEEKLQTYENLVTNVMVNDFLCLESSQLKNCLNYYKKNGFNDWKTIISDQYNFLFYLISQQKQNLSSEPSQFKSNSLTITTIKDLTNDKGWKYEENIQNNLHSQKVVSFIGDIESGKTHIINNIFNLTLPETSTNSIQIINPSYDESLLIIDTPGLNKISSLPLTYNQINETKQIDYIIKSIAVQNANIIFYITKSLTTDSQKDINKIQSMLSSSSSENSFKELFVLINCPFIYTEQQYQEYKKFFFDKNSFEEQDDLFMLTNIPNAQSSLSCLTVYAIYCPYVLNNIFLKIHLFINSAKKNQRKSIINDIILKPLSIAGVELFDLKENSATCEKNIITLRSNQKKQVSKNIENIEKKENKSIYQSDLSYWKYLENDYPGYAYYVKDNTILYIEIKCQCATKISIVYKGIKDSNHQFHSHIESFKKEDELYNSKNKYSNRKNQIYNLVINVPSSWGDIANKGKCKSMKYSKGIILLEFNFQAITDSISD